EAWPRRPELSTAVPVAATPAPLRNERRENPWELSGGDDLCFDMRPPPKAWETFYSALLWLSSPCGHFAWGHRLRSARSLPSFSQLHIAAVAWVGRGNPS